MADPNILAQELAEMIGQILRKTIDPTRLDVLLVDDYGADSMDMVDIVESMERKYGVVVDNEQLQKLLSLGDVVRTVQEFQAAG
jgi:acyl carrier protein